MGFSSRSWVHITHFSGPLSLAGETITTRPRRGGPSLPRTYGGMSCNGAGRQAPLQLRGGSGNAERRPSMIAMVATKPPVEAGCRTSVANHRPTGPIPVTELVWPEFHGVARFNAAER